MVALFDGGGARLYAQGPPVAGSAMVAVRIGVGWTDEWMVSGVAFTLRQRDLWGGTHSETAKLVHVVHLGFRLSGGGTATKMAAAAARTSLSTHSA